MLTRFVALLLVASALTACESASDGSAATAGSGARGGGSDSAGASAIPPSGYATSVPSAAVQRGSLNNPADVERELVSTGDTVYFAFDSFALDSQAQATLDRQAALLAKAGTIPVTIEGHTDERGTREYNLALGERRATAVKDYLVALGINASRVRTISYGEERPAAIGSNEAAWTKNRRGVTVVVGAVPAS